MKKILFLLLFTVSIYGQTLQNPTFGIVTEKNNATDSTPAYFVTSQTDGVHKKTPAALIAFKSDLPASYTVIVYVNTTNPNSATIFDDVNPPTTNDNAFKTDADNLYIGTDASTWVYNGFIYVTKSIPDGSNFFIRGTTADAGNSKTENIERIGSIKTSQTLDAGNVNTGGVLANSIVSNGEIVSKKAGSDTVNLGSAFRLSNSTASNSMMFQLNASNGLDLWSYAGSTWNKQFTFSSVGYLGIGTNSPFRKFTLENAGGTYIGINDTNNNKYTFGSDNSGLVFFDDTHGRYMAMFDKITGAFSVDGNISATSYTGSATLTGTPTAPTAAAGTNTTQIATTAFVQGEKAITVRKISTNTTLSNSDNGKVILLTASCTVTLPNGLMNGFNCSFSTQAGATLTYSLGGSVVLINNVGTTMAEKLSHTIVNTGVSNQYLIAGAL